MSDRISKAVFHSAVGKRQARARRMQGFYMASFAVAIVALLALLYSIANQSFGLVAVSYSVPPGELAAGGDLTALSNAELAAALNAHAPRRLLVLLRDTLAAVAPEQFTNVTLGSAVRGAVPAAWRSRSVVDLSGEELAALLAANLTQEQLIGLVEQEVIRPAARQSWPLLESLTNRPAIAAAAAESHPAAELRWRSWVSPGFVTGALSSDPAATGIRPGLLGSIWLMSLTLLFAFPLGVGAAIYLEEYAADGWLSGLIETNIRNLAGVPSIIYGMLGLVIFVRALEPVTQGRTVLSGALTMALLILPLIIVSAQEALRAVPGAIREASYGLGATKWQTIQRQVLPAAVPGILTGTILAMSRAIGETAPLIVVGAAAYITVDPNGPFSPFTALPMLIYNWTSQPNPQFRSAAAAGIIVLLAALLAMNSFAIVMRNRAVSKRI